MKNSILTVIFVWMVLLVSAQATGTDSAGISPGPFTVTYTLDVKSGNKSGVAESYNGAIKTIFMGDQKVRSRMVSLMRVQSIFYTELTGLPVITIVKESGAKYKRVLDNKGWNKMNAQYEGLTYEFLPDSVMVLEYMCKKVQLRLKGNKTITAFYTTQLQHPLFGIIEPAFAGIPGIVLKYEYTNDDASFIYTATDISFNPIAADTYKIP